MDPRNLSFLITTLLIFTAALGGGLVAKKFRQPLILGYIIAGILLGNIFPTALDRQFIDLVSQVGVTLLLFTLGVEFSFQHIHRILSKISWAVALQILATFFVIFLVLSFAGFTFLPALFIAAATALSSTVIVTKILGERGELDTVHGELAAGWLVAQDLAVIPMMVMLPVIALLPASGIQTIAGALLLVGGSLLKAFVFLAAVIILGRSVVPKVLDYAAMVKSREFFLVATVAMVFFLAIAGFVLGLSAAMGAFIAGLLVAQTSQHHAVFAEIRPLRDIFAVVFFVSLGLVLPLNEIIASFPILAALTLVIFIVKWLLVMGLSRFLGFHRKASFLAAVSLTGLSEFGFIIAGEGMRVGAIAANHSVFLVTLTFFSLLISVPLISGGDNLYYSFFGKFGRFIPKFFAEKDEIAGKNAMALQDHVVICGYGRVGKYIGRALLGAGVPFLVVDYNHATVASLKSAGINVIFGDPADRTILTQAHVDRAKVLVIAIPDRHTQQMIIGNAQTLSRRLSIICRTHHEEDQRDLKALGVDSIIQPEFEAAVAIVRELLDDFGVGREEITLSVNRLKTEHGLG